VPRLSHRSRKSRYRSDFRSRPVPGHRDYGDGEDDGKYFRCANCGFICNIDRDELGGSASKSNIVPTNYIRKYSTDNNENGQPGAIIHGDINGVALLSIASLRTGHVIMENDCTGSPKTIRLEFYPEVSTGCPFCGSLNYKADY